MSTPRISARVSEELRARFDKVKASTNQSESELVRAACEEFFAQHRTTSDIIKAVIESVRRNDP